MRQNNKTVYLVDDEDAIRRSASFMLRTSGYTVEVFESGVAFLKEVKNLGPGCVLLDIRMPEMDGLDVQQALLDRGVPFPVVVMTGHGDVDVAVRAMKAGAVDFIEKPFEKEVLLMSIEEGCEQLTKSDRKHKRADEANVRIQALTPREQDVLHGLVKGHPNKTIAFDLGISPRTVEIHRANLMSKLEVNSLSDALRIAFSAGLDEQEESVE